MKKTANNIKIPEQIKEKILSTEKEVDSLLAEAESQQKTEIKGKISFSYRHSAPTDILTSFERAQSVCFITKYENLPVWQSNIDVLKDRGRFFVKNIAFLRHVLNEFRPIIQNHKDSIYFGKIHSFCNNKLMNNDTSLGLCINVKNNGETDITDSFRKVLGEKIKSIRIVLKKSEFGYIYNGILQHSDHQYTDRFWSEYHSGEINYVFIKHVMLLRYIRECLHWHYVILNQLTFPKLGPL